MQKVTWAEEKRAKEIAARKAADEAKRDPVMEQCVIAYVSHRRNGGTQNWDDYRTQWMREFGAAEERRMEGTATEARSGIK